MTKPSKVIHVHDVGDEVSEIDYNESCYASWLKLGFPQNTICYFIHQCFPILYKCSTNHKGKENLCSILFISRTYLIGSKKFQGDKMLFFNQ